VVEEGNPGVGLFGCFESAALFEKEVEVVGLAEGEGRENDASLEVMGMSGGCEVCEFVVAGWVAGGVAGVAGGLLLPMTSGVFTPWCI